MPEAVIRNLIGKGVPAWMPRLLAMAFGAPQPERVPEALARFDHHYASVLAQQTVVYAGVHEALTFLREAGLQLACVTNKDACFTDEGGRKPTDFSSGMNAATRYFYLYPISPKFFLLSE